MENVCLSAYPIYPIIAVPLSKIKAMLPAALCGISWIRRGTSLPESIGKGGFYPTWTP